MSPGSPWSPEVWKSCFRALSKDIFWRKAELDFQAQLFFRKCVPGNPKMHYTTSSLQECLRAVPGVPNSGEADFERPPTIFSGEKLSLNLKLSFSSENVPGKLIKTFYEIEPPGMSPGNPWSPDSGKAGFGRPPKTLSGEKLSLNLKLSFSSEDVSGKFRKCILRPRASRNVSR